MSKTFLLNEAQTRLARVYDSTEDEGIRKMVNFCCDELAVVIGMDEDVGQRQSHLTALRKRLMATNPVLRHRPRERFPDPKENKNCSDRV